MKYIVFLLFLCTSCTIPLGGEYTYKDGKWVSKKETATVTITFDFDEEED